MKKYAFIYRNHKHQDNNPYSGKRYSTPEVIIYSLDDNYLQHVLTVTSQTTIEGLINKAYSIDATIKPCAFMFKEHKTLICKVLSIASFDALLELVLTSKQFTRYQFHNSKEVRYSVKNNQLQEVTI